jgi:hypothetical protein
MSQGVRARHRLLMAIDFARGLVATGVRSTRSRRGLRPAILHTRPVPCEPPGASWEVHVLTSAQDFLDAVWAIKSLWWAGRQSFALCVHDDGTLDRGAFEQLRHHFPGARVIPRAQADADLASVLETTPVSRALRAYYTPYLKIFDFRHYLSSARMLVLDSDVLFFSEPSTLLRHLVDPSKPNTANRDIATAYTISTEAASKLLGVPCVERFNSGLAAIDRRSLDLRAIEELAATPRLLDRANYLYVLEQTLYAMLSSRFGVELLPEPYDMSRSKRPDAGPCKHYPGRFRHLMYGEGMWHLARKGLLLELAG